MDELALEGKAFKEMLDFVDFIRVERFESHGNFMKKPIRQLSYGLGENAERIHKNIGFTLSKQYKKIDPDWYADLVAYGLMSMSKLKPEIERHPLWEKFKEVKK